jgi:lipopolysaccharide transport system permease protein
VTLVPPRWRWWFYLNPMVGAVDGFRAALLGTPFNMPALGVSTLVTLLMVWGGLSYFRRIESRVADLV